MTEYAQFVDGEFVTQVSSKENLPQTWTWDDGSATSGFHLLDDETIQEAGWYKVDAVSEPKYNAETQRLVNEHIILVDHVATRTWDVEDIPAEPDPQPGPPVDPPSVGIEKRFAALEKEIATLKATKADKPK